MDIDILPEVFGVETSFEGGRTGTTNQVPTSHRSQKKRNPAGHAAAENNMLYE